MRHTVPRLHGLGGASIPFSVRSGARPLGSVPTLRRALAVRTPFLIALRGSGQLRSTRRSSAEYRSASRQADAAA